MTFALMFVNCFPERASDAEKKVREVKGVVESHSTSGAYDMIVKVKTRNEAELRSTIKSMTMITGIGAILTSIVYNMK